MLIGLILVIAGTGLNVLLAVLFNLISDLVGGVRITVIEEESARPMSVADPRPPCAADAAATVDPDSCPGSGLALTLRLGAIAQSVRAHP